MPPGRPSTNVACSGANVLVLLHGTPRSGSIYDPTPGAEFGGSDPPLALVEGWPAPTHMSSNCDI